MCCEPFAKNFRLLFLATPARAILTRQREHHRLVLPGAVAEALEIVVEAVNALDGLSRRLDRLERERVAEKSGIDVLLTRRRRVKIEVAGNQPRALQNLRDVRGARRDPPHDLCDVGYSTLVERNDLPLLRAGLFCGERRLIRRLL